jgi:hypothetical protein
MVESITAMTCSSEPSKAATSAVQNESRRPARITSARATKRCPRAGASKLILNSTLSTSLPLGAPREGSVAARRIGDARDDTGVEVAVLLAQMV